jgi:hypothetical protein
MKIREEFAEFWKGLRHAALGFVDWVCWHNLEISIFSFCLSVFALIFAILEKSQ